MGARHHAKIPEAAPHERLPFGDFIYIPCTLTSTIFPPRFHLHLGTIVIIIVIIIVFVIITTTVTWGLQSTAFLRWHNAILAVCQNLSDPRLVYTPHSTTVYRIRSAFISFDFHQSTHGSVILVIKILLEIVMTMSQSDISSNKIEAFKQGIIFRGIIL